LIDTHSTCATLQGDRGVNPANSTAIAGTFKDETVYFTKAVEDLKTRHQWRMVMKDVIMRDVVPTISLHGIDPTAEPAKDSDNTTLSAVNGVSKNMNASQHIPGDGGNDENDLDDVDDCTVIGADPGPLREPIPAHKVVTRKRGDQEVKLDLYGAWQTEPYMVSTCVCVCVYCQPSREGTIRWSIFSVIRYLLHFSFLPGSTADSMNLCIIEIVSYYNIRYDIILHHTTAHHTTIQHFLQITITLNTLYHF
jgi:hypothetical protein